MQNPSVPSKSGLINNLVAHQYITPMKSKYRRTLVIRTRSYITGASQEAHTTQASKVVRFGFLFFLFFFNPLQNGSSESGRESAGRSLSIGSF